jgi:protein-S-isoprenylcysteine O-methyltransferase Ste14
MKMPSAILGSAVFFLAAPGIVAGLAPWFIAGGYDRPLATPALALPGALLVACGLAFLLHAFARFALEGRGTPAPVAPTEQLVVGGVYRHVRNPMYLAVIGIILGQALLFADWPLFAYAVAVAMAMATFVRFYEEPTLARRYGAQYEAYRSAVPGWLPRLTPWYPR